MNLNKKLKLLQVMSAASAVSQVTSTFNRQKDLE